MRTKLRKILTKDINSGKLEQELSYLEGDLYLRRFAELMAYVESKPKSIEMKDLSDFMASIPEMSEEEVLRVVRAAKVQIDKLEAKQLVNNDR